MYKNKDNRKLVSTLYSSIQSIKKHSTNKVRLKWEKESGLISEEDWLNMCSVQSSSTSSGLWREFCWRNLIRYFITSKLKCVQTGEMGRGSMLEENSWQIISIYSGAAHLFGPSGRRKYGQYRTFLVTEMTLYNLFRHYCSSFIGARQTSRKILLAASKKAVTRKWLQTRPSTKTDWKDIVTKQSMERITFSLNLRVNKFLWYWEKWVVFLMRWLLIRYCVNWHVFPSV